MKTYIVLYREESVMCPGDAPFAFACQADDGDHAEDQCLNANPDADIVWVYEGDVWDKRKPKESLFYRERAMVEEAYADYWNNNPEDEGYLP